MDKILKRIEELRACCLEEDDQEPLCDKSVDLFLKYLQKFPEDKERGFCVSYYGEIWLEPEPNKRNPKLFKVTPPDYVFNNLTGTIERA